MTKREADNFIHVTVCCLVSEVCYSSSIPVTTFFEQHLIPESHVCVDFRSFYEEKSDSGFKIGASIIISFKTT